MAEDVGLPEHLARVLERLALYGESNAKLAQALGLTHETVKRYMQILLDLTDSRGRAGLVIWAWSSGWIYERATSRANLDNCSLPQKPSGRSREVA